MIIWIHLHKSHEMTLIVSYYKHIMECMYYVVMLMVHVICCSEWHWTWGSFRLLKTPVWDEVRLAHVWFADEPSAQDVLPVFAVIWSAILSFNVLMPCFRVSWTASSLEHCRSVVRRRSPLLCVVTNDGCTLSVCLWIATTSAFSCFSRYHTSTCPS